jgi:hypothetical protein
MYKSAAKKESILYGRGLIEILDFSQIEKRMKKKKKNSRISIYNSFLQSDILSGHILIDSIRINHLIWFWPSFILKALQKNEKFFFMGVFKFLNVEKTPCFYKSSYLWPFFFFRIKNIMKFFTPEIFFIVHGKQLLDEISYSSKLLGNYLENLLNENIKEKKENKKMFFVGKILSSENFTNISFNRYHRISINFFFMKFYSYSFLNLFFKKSFYENTLPTIETTFDVSKKYRLNFYVFHSIFYQIQMWDSLNMLEKIIYIKFCISETKVIHFSYSKKNHPLLNKVMEKLKLICF